MIKMNDEPGGNSGARRAAAIADDGEFKNLVELLGVYSELENELAELQVAANDEYLQTVDVIKRRYASIQAKMLDAEKALEVLARRHPDWFVDKKTVKTPYGSVSLKENPPRIVADNPEVSIALLEAEGQRDKEFNADFYLHRETTLNLEALAGMDDAQLKKFRLRREQSDTFTVKPAKLDLGKAVKESAPKEEK